MQFVSGPLGVGGVMQTEQKEELNEENRAIRTGALRSLNPLGEITNTTTVSHFDSLGDTP